MKRLAQIAVLFSTGAAVCLAPSTSMAGQGVRSAPMEMRASYLGDQKGKMKRPPDPKPPKPDNNKALNPPKQPNAGVDPSKPGPAARNMMGLPPAWVERLQDMPPDEQEKFLANNERFKNMTQQQQQQIRKRLQFWNNLTPDQRQELREREQIWEKMTPEQRQQVHDTLLPKWQAMPPASKGIIRRHLARLQGLSESERQAMLDNPAFMRNMTPEEQQMLRELSRLRVGSTPDAPPAP